MMGRRWISRNNVHVALGFIMIVCLALTIVAFPVAIIWIGQPIGNTATMAEDIFASVFSAAFFAAFALAMVEQHSRDPSPPL